MTDAASKQLLAAMCIGAAALPQCSVICTVLNLYSVVAFAMLNTAGRTERERDREGA
jgi:hypothetical protein